MIGTWTSRWVTTGATNHRSARKSVHIPRRRMIAAPLLQAIQVDATPVAARTINRREPFSALPREVRIRRKSSELSEKERWYCPVGCGKFYRRTSSRSIRKHMEMCEFYHRIASPPAQTERKIKFAVAPLGPQSPQPRPSMKLSVKHYGSVAQFARTTVTRCASTDLGALSLIENVEFRSTFEAQRILAIRHRGSHKKHAKAPHCNRSSQICQIVPSVKLDVHNVPSGQPLWLDSDIPHNMVDGREIFPRRTVPSSSLNEDLHSVPHGPSLWDLDNDFTHDFVDRIEVCRPNRAVSRSSVPGIAHNVPLYQPHWDRDGDLVHSEVDRRQIRAPVPRPHVMPNSSMNREKSRVKAAAHLRSPKPKAFPTRSKSCSRLEFPFSLPSNPKCTVKPEVETRPLESELSLSLVPKRALPLVLSPEMKARIEKDEALFKRAGKRLKLRHEKLRDLMG
ncbi:hypothetical protein AAMO2058_000273700 [Amorphochlora amoebiformis]